MIIEKSGKDSRLDTLIKNPNPYVRAAVAELGYGLDVLSKDTNELVMQAVNNVIEDVSKEKNYPVGYGDYSSNSNKESLIAMDLGLHLFINDECDTIREAVARRGYGLETLLNDESPFVRKTVAKQGYGLDILATDEDYSVRYEVLNVSMTNPSILSIMANDKDAHIQETAIKLLNNKSANKQIER